MLVGSIRIPSAFIGATTAEILAKYNYSTAYVSFIFTLVYVITTVVLTSDCELHSTSIIVCTAW